MHKLSAPRQDLASALADSNLLCKLRAEDARALGRLMEVNVLPTGAVIYDMGESVNATYFPCGASMAAFLVDMEDGRVAETGLVGREGAVGGIVSPGRLPAFTRAVVQVGGTFLRIDTKALEQVKAESASMQRLFASYADCLLAQTFQAVACNATHSIEQRAARWLLAAVERSGRREVRLTQEQLAGMLGVGRSYVSRVLRAFRENGALTVRRGRLTICDTELLRAQSCNCNELVRQHFDTVLKGVYPRADALLDTHSH